MWDSKESVYSVIKAPAIIKPRTPPPTAKEQEIFLFLYRTCGQCQNLTRRRKHYHELVETMFKKTWERSGIQRERKVSKLILRMKQMMKEKLAATFGQLPGALKPLTSKFLKKHSKEPRMIYRVDRCSIKPKLKPEIPLKPPKHGLSSGNNWITVNAVEMIKSKPNRAGCPKKKRRYVMKKNYGKVPVYLAKRNQSAAEKKKKDSPEEQAKCTHDDTRKLGEEERWEMVNNLKLKWAATNAQYQALSFVLDTESKKKRKERYERNLTNLEKDVTLLTRKVILVSSKAPPKIKKESAGAH